MDTEIYKIKDTERRLGKPVHIIKLVFLALTLLI